LEVTAKNIDRLVTTEMRWGSRGDRGIIAPLYECACEKLGGRSPSLVAAQKLIEQVSTSDNVFIMTEFASYPNMPYGETDGPLGVASLARAVKSGLGALPIIVAGNRDMQPICHTTRAAGLNVLEYSVAKATTSGAATSIVFPCVASEESKKTARSMMNDYTPKAVIAVETIGPNKEGVKHRGTGTDAEENEKMPELEHLFYEANKRGVLTIGVIDQGNELGSGTIEEGVRRITPYADVCQCPCGAGLACSVKADVVFPAAISNWGAYGIVAMLAYLLKKPEILQDAYTERRMLEACVMAGAVDGIIHSPVPGVDSVSHEADEALITMLHSIIRNALFKPEG